MYEHNWLIFLRYLICNNLFGFFLGISTLKTFNLHVAYVGFHLPGILKLLNYGSFYIHTYIKNKDFFILKTKNRLSAFLSAFLNIRMFLTFNFTFENKNRSIFCKAQLFFSFTKMRLSEQDVILRDCVREFLCLSDKRTPEYHQRDVTGNC